jgi:hypothetical protein
VGDPLDFLRTAEAGALLLVAAGAAATWTRLFPRLRTAAAPRGIVSLQLAFTAARAKAVIESWRARHLDGAARRSLFVDVPFVVFYAWTLGLLAVLAGRAAAGSDLLTPGDADTAAAAVAIGGWVAAFCDLVENGGLWLQLSGRTSGVLTAATSTVSAVKWLLAIGSGVASVVVLLLAWAHS